MNLIRAHTANMGSQPAETRVVFADSLPLRLKFKDKKRIGRPRLQWSEKVLGHAYDFVFPCHFRGLAFSSRRATLERPARGCNRPRSITETYGDLSL